MKILDKYITRDYLKLYFIFIFFFIAVFLLTDFFQSMASLKKGTKFLSLVEYYLLQIPSSFSLLSPLAAIVSALFVITYLSGTYQIQAIQLSGTSIKRIALPLLITGMVLSFVLLFLNETLTFQTNQLAQVVREKNFLRAPKKGIQRNIFIHVPPFYLFYIRSFNPGEAKMENVLIYESYPHLLITAKEGRWNGKGWIFSKGMEYSLKGKIEGTSFDKKFLPLDEDPDYFTKKYFPPEKMNISQLKKYIDEYHKSGFETLGLKTELNFKFSYPFTNLIFLLLALPIGLILRKGGRGASLALGLTISFGYYEAMALFKILGKGGIISPCLAAWIPNLIFLAGGIYLFTRIE
ncbi:MAG: LptF/LptG family permease [Candidatus Aerophobetes bacterium]|nr:LptF/LptG family permease [Candidatus Aerophobetes bacterium]